MWWDSKTRYLGLLPRFWEGVGEIQALAAAVEPELDALKGATKQLVLNRFPQTADESGVARWEKILGLASPIGGDLQSRRQAILSTLQTRPPINVGTVCQIVETYLGVPVQLRLKDYHLLLTYRGQTKLADPTPLHRLLRELLPANLTYEVSYAYVTWAEVQATEDAWRAISPLSWRQIRMGERGYRAVAWEELGQLRWEELETQRWEERQGTIPRRRITDERSESREDGQ